MRARTRRVSSTTEQGWWWFNIVVCVRVHQCLDKQTPSECPGQSPATSEPFPAALFLGLHLSIHLRYFLDFYFDFWTPQRLSRKTAAATGFTALLFLVTYPQINFRIRQFFFATVGFNSMAAAVTSSRFCVEDATRANSTKPAQDANGPLLQRLTKSHSYC